jgi:type II secretory pathway pseudopilin PulG
MSRPRREFTLAELIAVLVVVLSLPALIAIPAFERGGTKAKESATEHRFAAIAREAQGLVAFAGGTTSADAINQADDDSLPASPAGWTAASDTRPETGDAGEHLLPHEDDTVIGHSGVGSARSTTTTAAPPAGLSAPAVSDIADGDGAGTAVGPAGWTARSAELPAPPWSDIIAAGQEGSVEVTWQHQVRFTSYFIQCGGSSPQPLVAILVDPASQFWAEYGAVYQSMGYDVATFTAPADGTELSRLVRQPGPADALPFEHTCQVVGYPDIDSPAVYEGSNPATATPAPGPGYVPPPAAPTGLTATTTGPSTVDLAWDQLVSPPDVPFDGYRVYVDSNMVADVLATDPSLTYTASGLTSGMEHTFGVSSFGSGGESELSSATATPVPIVVASGLHGPADGPRGMAFDASGNLYVVIPDANTVAKVTPSGTVSVLTSGIATPLYVAVDGAGDAYVADGFGAVSKVTPAGAVSGFASGFGDVRGLAFDLSDNLYVADALGTVSKVTPSGAVSTAFTGFNDLQTMAADSAGDVYMANMDGVVIKLTSASHTMVGWAAPQAMAFDPAGNLYLAEANDTVYKVTPDGNTVTTVAGGFSSGVRAVAFHSGFLYVSEADGSIVKVG